jgi:hypothetical protein
MARLRESADQLQLGLERYHVEPTLCWWRADDHFLHWQCAVGAILSLFVVAGLAPAPCLFLLWVIYLSLSTVCGVFLGYQWDAFETGLLAIFAPWRLWPRKTQPRRRSYFGCFAGCFFGWMFASCLRNR